ncbi:MAG: outer membrane beta-barrel protein [Myxococcota bacterium]
MEAVFCSVPVSGKGDEMIPGFVPLALGIVFCGADPVLSLHARGGVQFGGSLGAEGVEATIETSPAITGGLGYRVRKEAEAGVWYGFQPTELRVEFDDGSRQELDAQVHHIMVNGLLEFIDSGIARPFVELGLGAVVLNINEPGTDTEARLAFSVGGGLHVALTQRIWLRVQLDLRLAFLGGGELFCVGAGGQVGCVVDVAEVLPQGNAGAGVVFRF